jgi:hypothetical protein
MRNGSRLKVGILAMASAITLSVAWPLTGHASGGGMGCNPGRSGDYFTPRFAGAANAGLPFQDVSSYILNYSPYVSTDNVNNRSSAWPMLTDNYHGWWAQVGWREFAYSSRQTFVQFTDNTSTGHATDWYTTADTLGNHNYYAVHTSADNAHFTYSLGSNTIYTGAKVFSPNEADILGETHTLASQMPGQNSIPEDFDQSYVKLGGSVLPFGGGAVVVDPSNPDTSWAVKYSATHFQIVDAGC